MTDPTPTAEQALDALSELSLTDENVNGSPERSAVIRAFIDAHRQPAQAVAFDGAIREAAQSAFDFLESEYGNSEGLDWSNADAGAVGDMLHKALDTASGLKNSMLLHAANVQIRILQARIAALESARADALEEAALHARVPGGAEVYHWLPTDKSAQNPHQTAKEVMRCALAAALPLTGDKK